MAVHDIAVDSPGPGRDLVTLVVRGSAAEAGGPGRMPQRAAFAAMLDAQLSEFGPGPEEIGVRRHWRSHDARVWPHGHALLGSARPHRCGLELQDPPLHLR